VHQIVENYLQQRVIAKITKCLTAVNIECRTVFSWQQHKNNEGMRNL